MPGRAYRPPKLDSPPVYTVGASRAIASFVARSGTGRRAREAELPGEIVASKATAAYRAHSYHTKVPPEGIVPFIERYSRPGDVVLDPFCGSGMTGVAALQAGRRAVLIDLSPAATFIASNYCARPDPAQLRREATRVLGTVSRELEPFYTTRCRECGGPAAVRFAVWSDRYTCPECRRAFALWDVAREGRSVAAAVRCPHCGREGRKEKWSRLDLAPVLIKYRCHAGCGSQEAPPEEADIQLARAADQGHWDDGIAFPRTAIPLRGDEIARVHNQGISSVDQLFTRRNLRAVATLWHAAATLPDLRCRPQLLFCLTASMPRASRTNKYIPALGVAPGPILGTMYIPGFHPELNVLALFQRKVDDAARYYKSVAARRAPEDAVRISTQSATDLSNIPDQSVDYAFTDPPFGSNIAYSELNLLWESWLGVRTAVADEAIVSRAQKKSVDDYAGMMAKAFAEVRRVLKRGARCSIVFHNTSGDVWRALQAAVDAAGLAVESAVVFDKGPNQSFKQFTANGAVTHDLVVTCTRKRVKARPRLATEDDVAAFLGQTLAGKPQGKPNARRLYSAAIAHFLLAGLRVPVGFKEFRRLLSRLCPPR